jgi:predicted metal-dependent phosphoesterase TrpH
MLYDIHIHSRYSDGEAGPEAIVKRAKSLGLGGIALTDHNEIKGALEALRYDSDGFKVIPGTEVSSLDGHILALGVKEIIPKCLTAEETIKRIHDIGGVAIAAHPFDRLRSGVGYLAFEAGFDAVEVYNGHTIMSTMTASEILKELGHIPAVGGSDAHLLCEIGSVVLDMEGDPLEAIIKGKVKISVNISKTKILFNHLKRKMARKKE